MHEAERPRGRQLATNVLRGAAVLGILLLNIVAMGLPRWAYCASPQCLRQPPA